MTKLLKFCPPSYSDGFMTYTCHFIFCSKGQDGGPKPESIRRVEKITNKTVTFYDVDLLDVSALRNVFQRVCSSYFNCRNWAFLSLICHPGLSHWTAQYQLCDTLGCFESCW